MSIKIHISSDTTFEGKSVLAMYLDKMLRQSGVKNISSRDVFGRDFIPERDNVGKIIPADELFAKTIDHDKFFEVEIIELSEHPDLDPPKCDCC